MADILNLAIPYFGLIFIGFACGKTRGLPESGLAWMNFFLLYVSLPALLFRIMSETPFSELNNPPFLIATTLATVSAFVLAMVAGRIIGELSLRKATMAGLAGSRALGGDRRADGRTAAGAERVRNRPAEQYLDRAGIRRRADRDLRLRGHADQR